MLVCITIVSIGKKWSKCENHNIHGTLLMSPDRV